MLEEIEDLVRQLSSAKGRRAWRAELGALPAILRWVVPWAVLGRTPIDANPCRWLLQAAKMGNRASLLATPEQQYSAGEIAALTEQALASLVDCGVSAGQRVAIVEDNAVHLVSELFACWALGAIPCLLDAALAPSWLGEQAARLSPDAWWGGAFEAHAERLGAARRVRWGSRRQALAPLCRLPANAPGLVLSTSGSEGAPKLCKVTVGRLMLSGHAFGGALLGVRRNDVIYCPLPLTHATGLMAGLMSALVHGATLYLPVRFSASRFFDDLVRSQATQLLYVGDLLRFVVAAAESRKTPELRLRVMVGNGLDRETFERVRRVFGKVRVIEFYGATELPALLVNFAGQPGAMGRVPCRRCSRFEIVQYGDIGLEDARRCEHGEVGELVIRLPPRYWPTVGRFEGYWQVEHERRAVRQGLFGTRDWYYFTGDRVYSDENDFLYFVERVGQVWRHRGHNVSLTWLAQELRRCDTVADCRIQLVALDDSPQRLALAWIVPRPSFEPETFSRYLECIPAQARPQFIGLVDSLPYGTSHKPVVPDVCRGRFNPADLGGRLYLWVDKLIPYDDEQWALVRSRMLAQHPGPIASPEAVVSSIEP